MLILPHPDDECRAAGAILAAKRAGHRVVLATMTGGEEGEIHHLPEERVRPQLRAYRRREWNASCNALGVDRRLMLPYRDSGMWGATGNDHEESLLSARLDHAARRICDLIIDEHPDVLVCDAENGTYGHPDHESTHDIVHRALHLLPPGRRPAKAYHHVIDRAQLNSVVDDYCTAHPGAPRPALEMAGQPRDLITTELHLTDEDLHLKWMSLGAYVTQNPANLSDALHYWFMRLGDREQYQLFDNRLGIDPTGLTPCRETDLFTGIVPLPPALSRRRRWLGPEAQGPAIP
ncbi:MAG TPA: PIG-L family deacetylase [Candidatus Dormibacteraeota bacterium]|jgi:LmbE family N-acetylglucosaminyl deacetylase|nr:PIG-L family deacetylase [Candidatus Dormibacteraeota bacterium]